MQKTVFPIDNFKEYLVLGNGLLIDVKDFLRPQRLKLASVNFSLKELDTKFSLEE